MVNADIEHRNNYALRAPDGTWSLSTAYVSGAATLEQAVGAASTSRAAARRSFFILVSQNEGTG
jgi:hypothetical protein